MLKRVLAALLAAAVMPFAAVSDKEPAQPELRAVNA